LTEDRSDADLLGRSPYKARDPGARRSADAKLVLLPGTGHKSNLEQPVSLRGETRLEVCSGPTVRSRDRDWGLVGERRAASA
jgi:pimeloyl-ACP methyl ester carboxylesterase